MGDDDRWMKKALRLARRGEGRTSPNPMVGAVVVSRSKLVASGWHRAAGEPHAEAVALAEAGELARGADLYVTLEPCSHHGRTPPCAEAAVAAGVRRVIAGTADPDPRVSGRGFEVLSAAGIEVTVGVLENEARSLIEGYSIHRKLGRPFVTYKAAVSLDGRIAAADRGSKWVSGDDARRDVHKLRARSDAICAGIGTVLADDPSLTVRGVRRPTRPLRVVADSHARTPPGARVISPEAPTLIAVTEQAPPERVRALEDAGAQVVILPSQEERVSVKALLAYLGERGVLSLLLEGGGTLAGAFAREGLIDRLVFYLAPKLLGSQSTVGAIEGWGAATMPQAQPFVIESVRKAGADLKITATPNREAL